MTQESPCSEPDLGRPFIIPRRAALPPALPMADGQRESLLRKAAHSPGDRDYLFQRMAAIQIVTLSGRGADCGIEPHEKHDAIGKARTLSRASPI